MEYQRLLHPAADHFQPLHIQMGRFLINTVSGPDGYRQRIHSGFLHKTDGVIRISQVVPVRNQGIFLPADASQLPFHGDSVCSGKFHRLPGVCDVLLQAQLRAVVHHRRIPVFHSAAGQLHGVAVIQMKSGDHFRILRQSGGNPVEKRETCVPDRAGGGLEDHGGVQFFRRSQNSLSHLHVFHIKGADGVPALLCVQKQFLRCNKRHDRFLLSSPESTHPAQWGHRDPIRSPQTFHKRPAGRDSGRQCRRRPLLHPFRG